MDRRVIGRRRGAIGATLVLALAACGGDDGSPPASSFFVGEIPTFEPAARPVADASPGTVAVVLGDAVDVELDVTQCLRGSLTDVAADGTPEFLLSVAALGTLDDGTEVSVTIRRFVTSGAARTFTDTVTYAEGPEEEPTRVLQAQRIEVGGLVTDARDPAAVGSLVVDDGSLVEVAGRFAPPGVFAGGDGLVGGSLAARCEG